MHYGADCICTVNYKSYNVYASLYNAGRISGICILYDVVRVRKINVAIYLVYLNRFLLSVMSPIQDSIIRGVLLCRFTIIAIFD